MTDRVFATTGDWAVASDGHQWTLMRRRTRRSGPYWHPVSFVRSTKNILAQCMRENGAGEETARELLAWLPGTFDEWKTQQSLSPEAVGPPQDAHHG